MLIKSYLKFTSSGNKKKGALQIFQRRCFVQLLSRIGLIRTGRSKIPNWAGFEPRTQRLAAQRATTTQTPCSAPPSDVSPNGGWSSWWGSTGLGSENGNFTQVYQASNLLDCGMPGCICIRLTIQTGKLHSCSAILPHNSQNGSNIRYVWIIINTLECR